MIRVSAIKIKPEHNCDDILNAVSKKLRLKTSEINKIKIVKKSLDARNKENICWNYIIDADVKGEGRVLSRFKNDKNIRLAEDVRYTLPAQGKEILSARPCIIGSGPAGLFCTYFLAKEGYRPILIERGQCVEERIKTIEKFRKDQVLNPESNVQFGEGGAGTFSDGKLQTGVNDKNGRNMLVLETFVLYGAKEDILYLNKPHIGTDVLSGVVSNMRRQIIKWGGDVFFNTKFTGFSAENGKISSISIENGGSLENLPCSCLVLAIGHSARDTFYMLKSRGLNMQAKSFAVGLRAEHLQEDINRAMYGDDYKEKYGRLLPPSDYKLTYRAKDGRGVYSFCMCPGGYVINSSSEEDGICVNGMSYSKRDGKNANSAIIVTVTPEDANAYENPLEGIEFQRRLERAAKEEGKGAVPVQRLKDFKENTADSGIKSALKPMNESKVCSGNLNNILPEYICIDIKEAFDDFGKKIKGFDSPDTILSAVESRTSSPIRLLRDEGFESNIRGIFPAGEGAGYAGGITSSAIDGIKVFEEIYKRYAPLMEPVAKTVPEK